MKCERWLVPQLGFCCDQQYILLPYFCLHIWMCKLNVVDCRPIVHAANLVLCLLLLALCAFSIYIRRTYMNFGAAIYIHLHCIKTPY